MNNFKFDLPTKIYFGTGEFLRIKTVLKRFINKKALIVIGQNSIKKYGYLNNLTNILESEKHEFEIFEGIEPNPRHDTVNKAASFARESKCDYIIAFGGGSVMDASKAIAISAVSGIDCWKYCNIKGQKTEKIIGALPLICIPTLAATGSECDSGAVITNSYTKQKAVIHGSKIFPSYSVIDPDFIKTVPINYIIDGGVDIICHSLETYLSNEDVFYLQDYLTYSICRTVKLSLDEIISTNNGSDSARSNLFWSSSLAMTGLLNGRSGPWPMHEIEHGISAIYDISHGLGLAYILISMMSYNINLGSNNYKTKIIKFIGFFLHENCDFYKNINVAFSDFKNYFYKINALRNDSKIDFNKIDENIISESILSTYSNSDNYIQGLKKLFHEDIIQILKTAKTLAKIDVY